MRLEERDRKGSKKSRITRDRDRDVSEKIALGLAQSSGQEMQFDQRLFNQTAGMDSGFGAEDGYGMYDKPLFNSTASSSVYKPSANVHAESAGGEDDAIQGALKNARFKVDNEVRVILLGRRTTARNQSIHPIKRSKSNHHISHALDFSIGPYINRSINQKINQQDKISNHAQAPCPYASSSLCSFLAQAHPGGEGSREAALSSTNGRRTRMSLGLMTLCRRPRKAESNFQVGLLLCVSRW